MNAWLSAVCAATLAIVFVWPATADDVFHPALRPRQTSSFQSYIYVSKPDSGERIPLFLSGLKKKAGPGVAANSYAIDRTYQPIGAAEP